MKNTTNNRAFNYGIAGVVIAFADTRDIVGQLQTTGSLNIAGLSNEVIETRGGFSSLPVAARRGIRNGEFTLSINECPAWIKQVALGGDLEELQSASAPSVLPKRDITGNSIPEVTLSVTTPAQVQEGNVVVRAVTATEANITVHYPDGEYTFTGIGAESSELVGTGLTSMVLTGMTPGDAALFKVRPAHSGGERVTVGQRNREIEYRIEASSIAVPGGEDALSIYTLPRVKFFGMPLAMVDNEAVNGVELTGKILQPKDGSAPFIADRLTL